MLIQIHGQSKTALTLLDVMIVVVTVALILSVVIPNYLRARKRAQARRELGNLRLLDAAMRQYSTDTAKKAGTHAVFADLRNYLKAGTALSGDGTDILGNPYGSFTIDSFPKVNPATFNAFSDVADAAFWSPFH